VLTLGIETSCDDTAAAVLRDGAEVLSSVVSSQDDLHAPFGGVVPEAASRRHLERIDPVVSLALSRAGTSLAGVSLIAVTNGPGLIGSLLVGLSYAKGLAARAGIPLVPVDHVHGHLLSLAPAGGVPFPCVSLLASGGHTGLFLVEGPLSHRLLGTTVDDAAGEALDKAAKLLGLGYPGGPALEQAAAGGDPAALSLPRPMAGTGLDFSFSGLKTALFTFLSAYGYLDRTREGRMLPLTVADLAASFQEAVTDVLEKKCLRALRETGVAHLSLAGGVACNRRLRERLSDAAVREGFSLHLPPPEMCTDNAVMIACAGHALRGQAPADTLALNAFSTKGLRRRGGAPLS
jgi:N6-L-threonylcarbamoyladenine synthase